MGKINKRKNKASDDDKLPFVSICTPTFNRRPFIPMMLECFRNQTYPKKRMEWIIIDDGSDPIKDLLDNANIPQIKYFRIEDKATLGHKRNLMHEKSCGDIIVYMDDDDYYPPERVEHAVEKLTGSTAMCAGCSELYIFYKHLQQMWQSGPFGQNHATAGTFAFKRELLKYTRYNDSACLAEEREFLKGYTIPLVQLEPLKTILVFSHRHNTFDKCKLLIQPNPQCMKLSNRDVSSFIRNTKEQPLKKFFLEDIDNILDNYKIGEPLNKPDVIKQTIEIDKQIAQMNRDSNNAKNTNNSDKIMMQQDGKEPVVLSPNDVISIINDQRQHIKVLTMKYENLVKKNDELLTILKESSRTFLNAISNRDKE